MIKQAIKKPLFHALFYAAGFFLLWVANKTVPTTMAGPGLDMLMLFILVVGMLCTFFIGIIQRGITLLTKVIIVLIHCGGIALLVWWLNQPLKVHVTGSYGIW